VLIIIYKVVFISKLDIFDPQVAEHRKRGAQ